MIMEKSYFFWVSSGDKHFNFNLSTMSNTEYDVVETDEGHAIGYPGEKPSKLQKILDILRSSLMKKVCLVAVVVLFVIILFIVGIGIGIAIGNTISEGENENTQSSEDSCIHYHFYSIDDFESEPIPDIPNVFDPIELQPINNSSSIIFPEGMYHPLLSEENSPEYVSRYIDDYDIDRNDITQRQLQESNEYQIKLNKYNFIDREQGVEELQQIITQYLAPYISQLDEPVITMWYELQYEKHGCGGDYSELRVRNYVSGKHEGSSSSSINKDVKVKSELVTTLMYPGSNYLDHFEMKLEQGILNFYFFNNY